jgi:hypothetical protein
LTVSFDETILSDYQKKVQEEKKEYELRVRVLQEEVNKMQQERLKVNRLSFSFYFFVMRNENCPFQTYANKSYETLNNQLIWKDTTNRLNKHALQ